MKRTILKVRGNEKEIRREIERTKNVIIMGLEAHGRKDSLRALATGLTPVLARIASKNNNAIGIDLVTINQKGKKEKAAQLAKLRQDIKVARKAKMALALHPAIKEKVYILLSLGASTKQSKEALTQSF